MDLQKLYSIYLKHPTIVIDSRKATNGCIFFALQGATDGNQFAEKALQNGASFAIIDNPDFKENEQCLLVDDSLKTLQDLANFHRKTFEIPVLAITGSNGKTTTKELINASLNSFYKTHCTKGNYNNHIGVPLTLLAMPNSTEIAIIEMGANHVGEIDFLCQIAEPTHGIITNIGKAHLEGFGGIEGVKKGKSELFKFLIKKNGVAFVNLDEPFLNDLSKGIKHRIFYHQSDNPSPQKRAFETKLIANETYLRVGFLDQKNLIEIQTQIIGEYNFNNIQTAITIGKYFKVPAKNIKKAIESYIPENNRSQIIEKGSNTFILDAYNANPTSMRQALNNLLKTNGKHKIAVLGEMLELGEYSETEHKDLLNYANAMNLDQIILVGNSYEKLVQKDTKILHFKDVDSLKVWFEKQHFQNSVILIKGSRGLMLEKVLA